MTTAERLKKKYGVRIVDDSFYSPRKHKVVKAYKMYSADGCPWENGLYTLNAVEAECIEWSDALISIKEMCDDYKKGC